MKETLLRGDVTLSVSLPAQRNENVDLLEEEVTKQTTKNYNPPFVLF